MSRTDTPAMMQTRQTRRAIRMRLPVPEIRRRSADSVTSDYFPHAFVSSERNHVPGMGKLRTTFPLPPPQPRVSRSRDIQCAERRLLPPQVRVSCPDVIQSKKTSHFITTPQGDENGKTTQKRISAPSACTRAVDESQRKMGIHGR